MGCDDDIVKCLMFWANFFLALVGISILSLGITYKINLEEFTYAIPKEYQTLILIPVLTIPLGSTIIVIAVFGCYGCITERSTILTILKCCGTNGSTYWTVIPKSCYETDTKNIYKEPCPALVSMYLVQCIQIVGITILALSATEIVGSVISFSFASYLRKNLRFQYMKSYPFDNEII
ncbi:hypothetical protein NQ314_020375 [Rhamnusium bicolor]|uniref:Tetraspanin n=1 Tax=Rhamnusium bicolor TaxID=1586634 RepID=A0AAV8WLX7_9CUCU|nr:hypothetical protein NQ314_020375 [Rhamnusium bicolor]